MTDAPRAKTAQESHTDTTLVARRLFRAPNARRMVVPILAISLFAGFLLDFPNVRASALMIGTVAFALPTLLTIALTQPLATSLGGRMYLRRSALLAFLGLVLVAAVLVVAVITFAVVSLVTARPYAYPVDRVALLGYAAIIYLRNIVLEGTSSTRARAVPAALLQTVLGFVGIGYARLPPIQEWLFAAVFVAAFYAVALAFTGVVRRPFLRVFGIDGMSLLRYTIDHFTEQGDEARRELEAFFARIAIPAKVRVGAIGFRSGDAWRGVLVAPMVHPGPVGTIGGSDLPAKLATALADMTPNVLVAHGPTTHDQNPADSAECDRLAASVRSILDRSPRGSEAGSLVRATDGLATVGAQAFGGAVLITATLAPNPTDDIDSATGFGAVQEARLAGARDAVFIDAHNCMQIDSGLTLFGTPASHAIVQATGRAAMDALRTRQGELRVGFRRRAGFATPVQGIGGQGIQAVVVEASGRRTAYVLFDGNNMVPGLRDDILARLASVVDDAEVLTSDNHAVNLTMGGFNPVGLGWDRAKLVSLAEETVRGAVEDLAPSEVCVGSEWVDLRIFGPEAAARLTTSVNATIAVVRPAFLLTFGLGFIVSALAAILA